MSDETIKLSDLAKRYLELGAIIDSATEEQEAIKATLRQLGLGRFSTGVAPVVISPNRRFDAGLAEKVLGAINPDLIPACSETLITASKAKTVLPPAVYEQCMKANPNHKVQVG